MPIFKKICCLVCGILSLSLVACNANTSYSINALKSGAVTIQGIQPPYQENTAITVHILDKGENFEKAQNAVHAIAERFTIFEFADGENASLTKPTDPLTVSFSVPMQYNIDVTSIYFVDETGSLLRLPTNVDTKHRRITVQLDHFGVYTMVELTSDFAGSESASSYKNTAHTKQTSTSSDRVTTTHKKNTTTTTSSNSNKTTDCFKDSNWIHIADSYTEKTHGVRELSVIYIQTKPQIAVYHLFCWSEEDTVHALGQEKVNLYKKMNPESFIKINGISYWAGRGYVLGNDYHTANNTHTIIIKGTPSQKLIVTCINNNSLRVIEGFGGNESVVWIKPGAQFTSHTPRY